MAPLTLICWVCLPPCPFLSFRSRTFPLSSLPLKFMPDMAGVFVPFRLPAVADLDMVLQTGPKSRLKREETRCLNGSDSEPVKWTQVNNPFSAFTRGGLSSPNLQPNALACACLPIHLVAHISCQIAHLILSISVLSWKLVPGYLDDTLDNPTDTILWASNWRDTNARHRADSAFTIPTATDCMSGTIL